MYIGYPCMHYCIGVFAEDHPRWLKAKELTIGTLDCSTEVSTVDDIRELRGELNRPLWTLFMNPTEGFWLNMSRSDPHRH